MLTAFPPYDPTARCPKCAYERVGADYIVRGKRNSRKQEHLRRICWRCGYVWCEACADVSQQVTSFPAMTRAAYKGGAFPEMLRNDRETAKYRGEPWPELKAHARVPPEHTPDGSMDAIRELYASVLPCDAALYKLPRDLAALVEALTSTIQELRQQLGKVQT